MSLDGTSKRTNLQNALAFLENPWLMVEQLKNKDELGRMADALNTATAATGKAMQEVKDAAEREQQEQARRAEEEQRLAAEEQKRREEEERSRRACRDGRDPCAG